MYIYTLHYLSLYSQFSEPKKPPIGNSENCEKNKIR